MNTKEMAIILIIISVIVSCLTIAIMRMQIEYKKLQIVELLQEQAMQEIKYIKENDK